MFIYLPKIKTFGHVIKYYDTPFVMILSRVYTCIVYHMCGTWSWRTFEMHSVLFSKSGVTASWSGVRARGSLGESLGDEHCWAPFPYWGRHVSSLACLPWVKTWSTSDMRRRHHWHRSLPKGAAFGLSLWLWCRVRVRDWKSELLFVELGNDDWWWLLASNPLGVFYGWLAGKS
jgi:hypothetical protein